MDYTRKPPGGRWSATHLNSMGSGAARAEAAALLRSYHRQVEEWFVEFAQARSRQRKRERACALAAERGRAPGAVAEELDGVPGAPLAG